MVTYNYKFSFFFNLVEKNSLTVKKFSKCRENGIDRLRNGKLPRRLGKSRSLPFATPSTVVEQETNFPLRSIWLHIVCCNSILLCI